MDGNPWSLVQNFWQNRHGPLRHALSLLLKHAASVTIPMPLFRSSEAGGRHETMWISVVLWLLQIALVATARSASQCFDRRMFA